MVCSNLGGKKKYWHFKTFGIIELISDIMKTIVFRYFDVDYAGLTSSSSLVARFIGKLSSTAADRMMPVNKQESDKSDLISEYGNVNNGKMVTGAYLRIVNSKNVPIITEDMLKQNQFKVSSINMNAKDKEKTCLDYFYFCLSDTSLIVTLDSRCGINRFETYINWLLKTKETGERINFTPTVDGEKISASDIKKITINNSYEITPVKGDNQKIGVKSKMVNLTMDILKELFSETDTLQELMDANICSADLVIKFSKPRGMAEDEYKRKTAGAILKPMEDPDGVHFTSNGKKNSGSQILRTENVEVDCDENGAISEQEVYQKMIQMLMQDE